MEEVTSTPSTPSTDTMAGSFPAFCSDAYELFVNFFSLLGLYAILSKSSYAGGSSVAVGLVLPAVSLLSACSPLPPKQSSDSLVSPELSDSLEAKEVELSTALVVDWSPVRGLDACCLLVLVERASNPASISVSAK